ncbi:MAG TPA: hypothetical protein PK413_10335, partial [Thermoanaerobaculia bacterium]|nr:hypothetical protein [Thermoanaerobaculia bacterium]
NHARRLRDTLPAARGLDLLFSELTGEPEAQSQKIWDMVLLGGEWQMLAVGDGKLGLLSVATPQIDSDTFLYCARFAFEAVLELAPAQLGQLEGGRREASA